MLKPIAAVAGVLMIAAASLLSAAPASAAPLPAGDALYTVSCEEQALAALYSVDVLTAELTEIGETDLEGGDCAGEAAYDPTTGTSYYLSWENGELVVLDVATGEGTVVDGITGGDSAYPDAIAIGLDGKAYITWNDVLYSLDLSTAELTVINPDMTDGSFYAFSVDPTSGKFYAIQLNDTTVYEVNVSNGALTEIGTIANLVTVEVFPQIESLKIDTSGAWWFINEEDEGDFDLYTMPLPSGPTEAENVGVLGVDGGEVNDPIDTEALLLTWPVPAKLADTGSDATIALTGAGGAAVLLAAGVVLIFTRRVSRR